MAVPTADPEKGLCQVKYVSLVRMEEPAIGNPETVAGSMLLVMVGALTVK